MCRIELVLDESETDAPSLVGDICHIRGEKPGAARHDTELPPDRLHSYSNLIVLCKVHHKQIDDQPKAFTAARVEEIKNQHEEWVRTQLAGFSPSQQRDDEAYAAILQEWEKEADLDRWVDWTSCFFNASLPVVSKERHARLQRLRTWLLSRVWPGRYPELETALNQFRMVLGDLLNVFDRHAIDRGSDFWTEKFYKHGRYDPKEYDRRVRDYENHVGLVEDLAIELTRAGNLACDRVREYLMPSYRLQEGVLMIERGPDLNFQMHVSRPEYRGPERNGNTYESLSHFVVARTSRDLYVGDLPEN